MERLGHIVQRTMIVTANALHMELVRDHIVRMAKKGITVEESLRKTAHRVTIVTPQQISVMTVPLATLAESIYIARAEPVILSRRFARQGRMVMLAFCPGTAHRETIAKMISVVMAQ